jgi:hypothetical protein
MDVITGLDIMHMRNIWPKKEEKQSSLKDQIKKSESLSIWQRFKKTVGMK